MPRNEPTGSWGLMGWYQTPGELLSACEALKREGYTRFDAHTPFPVHGLERALELPPSPLPKLVLAAGLAGLLGAMALQLWTMGIDYPQNISGKPLFAYQAYVPVAFEATVLLASFACFFGMWWLNGLPRFVHPTAGHPSFPRASDDRFFVAVELADPRYDQVATRALLEALGAKELQEVAW